MVDDQEDSVINRVDRVYEEFQKMGVSVDDYQRMLPEHKQFKITAQDPFSFDKRNVTSVI